MTRLGSITPMMEYARHFAKNVFPVPGAPCRIIRVLL